MNYDQYFQILIIKFCILNLFHCLYLSRKQVFLVFISINKHNLKKKKKVNKILEIIHRRDFD